MSKRSSWNNLGNHEEKLTYGKFKRNVCFFKYFRERLHNNTGLIGLRSSGGQLGIQNRHAVSNPIPRVLKIVCSLIGKMNKRHYISQIPHACVFNSLNKSGIVDLDGGIYFMLLSRPGNHGIECTYRTSNPSNFEKHARCRKFPKIDFCFFSSSVFARCYHNGSDQRAYCANSCYPICQHCRVHARPRRCAVSIVRRCAQGNHQRCPSKPSQHKYPYQKEILS